MSQIIFVTSRFDTRRSELRCLFILRMCICRVKTGDILLWDRNMGVCVVCLWKKVYLCREYINITG